VFATITYIRNKEVNSSCQIPSAIPETQQMNVF